MENGVKKLKRVVIKEEMVALTGDPIKAIILNQILYWTDIIYAADADTLKHIEAMNKIGKTDKAKQLEEDLRKGWFWKSAKELQEEIMISTRATVDRKMGELIEAGFVSVRKNPKNKMDRTNQYKANIPFIQQELEKLGYPLEGYSLSKKMHMYDELQIQESRIAQNEQSGEMPVSSIAQNEQCNANNEQSIAPGEQTIPEITSKITYTELKNDDEELNKTTRAREENTLSFFQREIIEECQERNVPSEEVGELLKELGDTKFTMQALDNTFDKVMDKYERGEVSAFGKYFVQVLKREQRRLSYAHLQQARREQAATQYKEFPFYNWLEDEGV